MRRTTLWAVFTSMNEQPAWRSMVQPAEPPAPEPAPKDSERSSTTSPEPLTRPAPDTRRDRVELM